MNAVSTQQQLGGLLLDKRYVCSLTVPHNQLHSGGFVVYQIVIRVLSKAAIDEDQLEFTLWRRYSVIGKLHDKLGVLHRQWHLKGKFPEFAKPKLFGNKEDIVVLERQLKAEAFLQFVIKDPILCKTPELLSFLEEGVEVAVIKSLNEPLTPAQLPITPPLFESDENSEEIVDLMEPTKVVETHTEPMEKSLPTPSSELEEIFGAVGEAENFSAADMEFFDPCSSAGNVRTSRHLSQEEKAEKLAASNLWLLSTMGQLNIQPEVNPSLTTSSRSESPCESSEYSVSPVTTGVRYHPTKPSQPEVLRDDLADVSSTPNLSGGVPKVTVEDCHMQKKSSTDSSYHHDIRLSDKLATDLASKGIRQRLAEFLPKFSFSGRSSALSRDGPNGSFRGGNHLTVDPTSLKQVKSEANLSAYESKQRPMGSIKSISGSSSRLNSPMKSSLTITSELKISHTDDYLYQAAQFISSAQKSEAEGYYDLAFSCYKAGVNLLISGVQDEKDVNKRNAVRQKTAKYLVKAERIYQNYLACDNGDVAKGDLWTVDFGVKAYSDPTLLDLQGSANELRSLTVVKVVNLKLMLVQEPMDSSTYVLKSLSKTCYPERPTARKDNFLPLEIPFMAQLVKFYETESAIFLQLEYFPDGSLWDCLKGYFDHRQKCFLDDAVGRRAPKKEPLPLTVQTTTEESPMVEVQKTPNNRLADGARSLRKTVSTDSWEELSVDISSLGGLTPTPSPGLQSPNPDLKIQNVLSRLNATKNNFSIDEEEETADRSESKQSSRAKFFATISEVAEEIPIDPVQPATAVVIPIDTAESLNVGPDPNDFSDCSEHLWGPQMSVTIGQLDLVKMWFCSVVKQRKPVSYIPEDVIRVWAAQLILSVSRLHAYNFIIKDLGPQNLLVREDGLISLTFMAEWTVVDRFVNLSALKQLYSAPEISGAILPQDMEDSCDWFSVGAILFELVAGVPLHRCCCGHFPSHSFVSLPTFASCSDDLRDFIEQLLAHNPTKRLGAGRSGPEDLKSHRFFAQFNWEEFEREVGKLYGHPE